MKPLLIALLLAIVMPSCLKQGMDGEDEEAVNFYWLKASLDGTERTFSQPSASGYTYGGWQTLTISGKGGDTTLTITLEQQEAITTGAFYYDSTYFPSQPYGLVRLSVDSRGENFQGKSGMRIQVTYKDRWLIKGLFWGEMEREGDSPGTVRTIQVTNGQFSSRTY